MEDEINTSIEIHSDLSRVWTLISEPGWWINNGKLGGHHIERDGDECVVSDSEIGSFKVGIVRLEEPHLAVFTWQPSGDDVPRTTVEFRLSQPSPGTVAVFVTETGFAAMTAEQHKRNFESNVSGWELELELAAAWVGGSTDAARS